MENEKIEFDWFPLKWTKFLLGTSGFSAQEIGAYLLLLIHQWDKGFIPENPEELETISKVSYKKLTKVLKKFKKFGGNVEGLYNVRLEIIRGEQEKKAKTKSERGKKGAEARWKQSTSNAQALQTDAIRGEEKREEEIREEEIRGEENPAPDLKDPLKFYVGPEHVDDLKIFLEKKFGAILNNLKKDYGEGIYNEAFKRFSEKNIGHNWTDDQDLRKHFTSSLMIFKDNQDAKRTNGPKNSSQSKSSITKGPGKF